MSRSHCCSGRQAQPARCRSTMPEALLLRARLKLLTARKRLSPNVGGTAIEKQVCRVLIMRHGDCNLREADHERFCRGAELENRNEAASLKFQKLVLISQPQAIVLASPPYWSKFAHLYVPPRQHRIPETPSAAHVLSTAYREPVLIGTMMKAIQEPRQDLSPAEPAPPEPSFPTHSPAVSFSSTPRDDRSPPRTPAVPCV